MWLKDSKGEYVHTESGAVLCAQSNEDGTGKVTYASSPYGGVRNRTLQSEYKDTKEAQAALDELMDSCNEGFLELQPPVTDEEV